MSSVDGDLGGLAHLVRRFLWSLKVPAVAASDEAWLLGRLTRAEVDLYRAQSAVDRAHAVRCAVRASLLLGTDATDDLMAAAALHDVGKSEAALGIAGRVWATAVGRCAGAGTVESWRGTPGIRGRVESYLRHPEIGAEMLEASNSGPAAISWARDHHRPAAVSGLGDRVVAALKEADN